MPSLDQTQGCIRFEGFELDLRAAELCPTNGQNGGSAVRLAEQPVRILCMLLEHSGQVVTREEIRKRSSPMTRLWSSSTTSARP
jgi:DNA-binding response OmpR family regulator